MVSAASMADVGSALGEFVHDGLTTTQRKDFILHIKVKSKLKQKKKKEVAKVNRRRKHEQEVAELVRKCCDLEASAAPSADATAFTAASVASAASATAGKRKLPRRSARGNNI
jgi:hypothetical protein